jgi:hypothetical protein
MQVETRGRQRLALSQKSAVKVSKPKAAKRKVAKGKVAVDSKTSKMPKGAVAPVSKMPKGAVAPVSKMPKAAIPPVPVDEDVTTEQDKMPALGGKGKKGSIDQVLEYAIACCEADCLLCYQFGDKTLKAKELTKADIRWTGNGKFVDFQWSNVPARFKRIRAFTKMKDHLKEVHKYDFTIDRLLPPLFKKGTLEQEERKKKKLIKHNNRNNPSAVDIPVV